MVDEILQVYLILTIPVSATTFLEHDRTSRQTVQDFFQASITIHFEAHYPSPQASATASPRASTPIVGSQIALADKDVLSVNLGPVESTRLSPATTSVDHGRLTDNLFAPVDHAQVDAAPIHLFTLNHPPTTSKHLIPPLQSLGHARLPSDAEDFQNSLPSDDESIGPMRLGKHQDQWVISWKLQGKIGEQVTWSCFS